MGDFCIPQGVAIGLNKAGLSARDDRNFLLLCHDARREFPLKGVRGHALGYLLTTNYLGRLIHGFVNVFYLPFQGANMKMSVFPKRCHWAELSRAFSPE